MSNLRIINNLTKGILSSTYQYFFASVIMAVLCTFAYLFFRRYGIKNGMLIWFKRLKHDKEFRSALIMAFLVSMVLYKTLLCRLPSSSQYTDVWGSWWIYNNKGKLSTDSIQNFCLIILPVFMLFLLYSDKIFAKKKETFWRVIIFSVCISFLASFTIEILQMFFSVGAFQVSDLAYNTLGGILGAIIYYIVKLIKKIKMNRERG